MNLPDKKMPVLSRILSFGKKDGMDDSAHAKSIVAINTGLEPLMKYKKTYGDTFVYDIDRRDEMYLFLSKHPAIKDPIGEYYRSGESMLECLNDILAENNINYDNINRFLDFASGYGRFTRFLIQMMDNKKITVSDIDRNAVDFCKKTYRVNGYYSMADPDGLAIREKYDVIWVASLFSHLSQNLWGKWLVCLYNMLSDKGILIFSTHGTFAYNAIGEDNKTLVGPSDNGFYYWRQSETERLPLEEYGTAYVTYDFVRDFIERNRLGKTTSFYDHALWGIQDIYVIKK